MALKLSTCVLLGILAFLSQRHLITEKVKKHDLKRLNFVQIEVRGQLTQTGKSFQICMEQLLKYCI